MLKIDPTLYQHKPLVHKGEIRLLHLEPSRDTADSEITCHLKHHQLHEGLDFEAVSYFWGNQSTKHKIHISGTDQQLDVGENCFNLLHALRKPDQERVLWIDAVCINQNDLDEKSQQIPIIGHIYATARRTVIYLQRAEPELKRHYKGISASNTPITGLDSQAKQSLFRNPWFKRVWIVQEVLLSEQKTVCIPPFEWDWEELCQIGRYGVMEMNDRYRYNRHSSFLWEVGGVDKPTAGMMPQVYILDFLIEARDFGCTEYHDKFYSLLSLFKDPLDIIPDYRRSKQQVQTDFTRALLHTGESRFWYSKNRTSWRPDWDTALHDLTVEGFRVFARNFLSMGGENSLVGNPWDRSARNDLLHRYAYRIARVDQVSAQKLRKLLDDFMDASDPSSATWIKENWNEIMKELNLSIVDDESGAAPVTHIHRRNHKQLSWFRKWIDNVEDVMDKSEHNARDPKTTQSNSYNEFVAKHATSLDFYEDMRVFTSHENGAIGIGPEDIQVGDEVWYLMGLNCPLVIVRPLSPAQIVLEQVQNNSVYSADAVKVVLVGLCFFGVNAMMPSFGPKMANLFSQPVAHILEIH